MSGSVGPSGAGRSEASPSSLPAQMAAALAGAVATVAAAVLLGLPGRDVAVLVGLAVGGAVVAGVAGVAVLRTMRTASLRRQAVAVALTAVLGTGVGVTLAARSMFVSTHDLGALVVVLLASATVAVVLAIRFGSRITTASRDLEDLARRLGDGDLIMVGDVPVAAELRRLATELSGASERLDDARRKADATERARRELVAWVSHDLRTPLAGIRAMVEALEDGIVDSADDVARYHETMRRETDRLALLVDDLFQLSRIEAEALDLELLPVALRELVDEAVSGAAPIAAAKGQRLRPDGLDTDIVVRAAPAELVRAIRNLLDNAIRHTPAERDIVVAARRDEGAVTVSVHDACGGIPDLELARVFEPAFRGDAARSGGPDRRGGLGLAIAKGVVDAHGGSIAVANDGPGCRFSITLPVQDPAG